MPRVILLALALGGFDLDIEPPPLPSGMDLLYSDRVAFGPGGEPIVTVGLMTGQETLRFSGEGPLRLDFYEEGMLKQTVVPAGSVVTVQRRRAQPARRTYYVELDAVPLSAPERLEAARAGWRVRGYPTLQVVEEGSILGIGGRVLDNRSWRLTLPAATQAEAERLADAIYRTFGDKVAIGSRLAERPWGELAVTTDTGWVGLAVSFVRAIPERGAVKVLAVEHGRGYAWAGREDRRYRGEIYAVIDPDGALAAVNVLGAEQVLRGVVPSELFATAPPEALKAQAVAARNHLLGSLGLRHHGDPFHLCAEQHCQVYAGLDKEDPRTDAAVQHTWGETLFGGHLVHAVYSSSCGGFTEDNEVVWGDAPDRALRATPDFDIASHPELARFADGVDADEIEAWVDATPATYCAHASFARPQKFRWKRRFEASEVRARLTERYGDLGPLREVAVAERGRGGKVVSLLVRGDREATVLRELPIRRVFDNLNSGAFVVHPELDARGLLTAVTFVGGGWGHGVGMCQMGAIGRAEAGHGYRQILAHYYRGTELVALYQRPEPDAALAIR